MEAPGGARSAWTARISGVTGSGGVNAVRAEGLVRMPVRRPVDALAAWYALAGDHPDLVWSEPTGRRGTAFLGLPRSAEDVLIWDAEGNPGRSASGRLGEAPVEAV